MDDLLLAAYSHHTLFEDLTRSLWRGLLWAGAFRVMRGVSLPVAIGLVLVVLLVALVFSRRT